MFSQDSITLEQHQQWFERIRKDPRCDYRLFLHKQEPVGLSYLTDINQDDRSAQWGFYIGVDTPVRGLGLAMGYLTLDRAFGQMQLRRIDTQTFAFNTKALRYEEKLGFSQVPESTTAVLRDGRQVSVLHLSITHNRWHSVRNGAHA